MQGLLKAYQFACDSMREDRRTIQSKLNARVAARLSSARTSAQHARELEHSLWRVALLARALAEVCLKKGLLSESELGAMLAEVDMADGVGDGILDPWVVMPGESKLADLKAHPPPPPRVRKQPRRS